MGVPSKVHAPHFDTFVPIKLCVPMRYFPFRQFVLSGKNRYDISHDVVQKVVARKIREPI